VWIDALTQKVREGGRTVNVHVLVATGVNADGHREILGVEVTSAEDGAGWVAFLRGLVARGLSGVQLVISDAHRGLVEAIAATLPGAGWQRYRTHYLRNLLTKVPKSAQPWVATLVRTIFDQPAAEEVAAQHARWSTRWKAGIRRRRPIWTTPRAICWPSPPSPGSCGADLVQQSPTAAEQGDPAAHRCGRDLPRPGRDHPPGRRGATPGQRLQEARSRLFPS
jgi:transposase-like protein